MPEPEYPPDLDAHLWRRFRNVSGRLNCGILIDARGGIEEWAQKVLDLLSREPALSIAAIYLLATPDPARNSKGGILYQWLTQWSSKTQSPLSRVELRVPNDPPVVPLGNFGEEGRARVAAAGLDVLLWLESGALELDCTGLSRLGVWSIRCGDPDEPRSEAPFWQELQTGRSASAFTLVQDTGSGDVRRLAVCHVATYLGLHVTRNAVPPLTLAGLVILRNLLDLLDPERASKPSPVNPPDKRRLSLPGNLDALRLIARQSCGTATIRWRGLTRPAKWSVAIRDQRELFRAHRDRFVPEGFREVPSPSESQLADPFVVSDNGRHWLFVEEIPRGTSKGRLAVMEIKGAGSFGDPVTILERPYHLSYPFVFRDGGEFYMLPETAGNRSIELYRATSFPFEWKLEHTLFSNVSAVDSTPLFLDGIWYLWTTSARLGDETFLFWAKSLDGEWRYHPCNPICSDVRRARGAGPLFYSQGSLIRPSQDCSVRYGYAIALNRVLKLSPDEYEEELIEVIDPSWRKGLIGTHTLSSHEEFEAIDGLS